MSSIDPKRAGKCWSCKYCEDVGTYRYEDSVFYMRKCTKSGHEYVDDCEHYCSDYVWDGKTQENSSSSSSSSSYTSSSSSSYSSSDGPGCGKVLLIIGIVVAVLALGAFFLTGNLSLGAQKAPASSNSAGTIETSMHVAAVVKTSGSNLRMRSAPSTDHEVVESVPNGASVTILDQTDSWSLVDYNGTTGWCFTKYLQEQ